MFRLFLFLPIFFFCFQATGFALTVSFNKEAEITNPYITLNDIAILSDDSVLATALGSKHIAVAPKAGATATITTQNVKEKLLRQLPGNITVQWSGSPTVLVQRKGITINPQDVQSTIDTFLLEKQDELPVADYSFIPRELPLPFVIPTGILETNIIPSDPKVIGSRRMSILYKIDGKVIKNISVRGKLTAMAPVAVLSQNVKRGSLLYPDMVNMQLRDLGKLRNPCTDLREVLGKKLTRTLRTGTVLDLSSIDFPPLVQKGQLVKILINQNGLHLSATGVASMEGKQDQIIRVMNTGSQKIIFCKVAAPGIVEVQI